MSQWVCFLDSGPKLAWGQVAVKKNYKDIAEDVETRFDISNYELDKPLPNGKNKEVIGLIKDEFGGKIMTKFVWLRAKSYSYLIDDRSEDKKSKRTKKCVLKKTLNLKNIKTVWKQRNLKIKRTVWKKSQIDIDSL